jgi:FixJ family two-component response regulator
MAQDLPMIVLVEDDDGLRSALVGMLSVSGFRMLAFATAENARDYAKWDDAACIVADVRLPGMSGFDLLRWLRRSGRSLPAIVMTAAAGERARDEATALGVSAYLEKPVDGRRLVTAIRKAISS